MPELAEVEIARRQLERWWVGRVAQEVVAHDAQYAGALGATCGVALRAVRRRGKYLALDFEGDVSLKAHLRMTGRFIVRDGEEARGSRVAWRLGEGEWVHFEDMRRLGELHVALEGVDPLEGVELGPEPHDLANGKMLRARFEKGSRRRLKDALLDQRVVAGVGNIAISELFWRVGLAPTVRCDAVSDAKLDALVAAMPGYFDDLIAVQGEEELQYVNQGGVSPFQVYGRAGEPCRACEAGTIERMVWGGRSTYYCGGCQQDAPTAAAEEEC